MQVKKQSLTDRIRNNLSTVILCVVAVWFIIAFILDPNFSALKEAFVKDGKFTLSAFGKIAKSKRTMKAIGNSVKLAFSLMITANIVGTFQVFITEYFDIKGSKLLRLGYMNTLIFGGLILGNGYLLVYGEKGVLTQFLLKFFPDLNTQWFKGFPAVLFMMTFACTQDHMIFLRNAINGIDYSMVEAAQNLGESQWGILKKIILPTLKPTFNVLLIRAFSTGLGAFAAPLMVGGKDFQTISPLILDFANRPKSRDISALISILLGLVQIISLAVLSYYERQGNYMSISKTKTRLKKVKIQNPVANTIVHILAYVVFFINVLPFILVILFSFMNLEGVTTRTLSWSNFTLSNYAKILTDSSQLTPILRSMAYSAIAAIISVIFMLLIARLLVKYSNNKFIQSLEVGFNIPVLLPSILLALGLILSYSSPNILIGGQTLIATNWIMIIAYTVVLLPGTLRYLKAAFYSFDDGLEEASQILGASEFTTFRRVIVPSLLPTVLALFALNFNSNLTEYNMSAFLYKPGNETAGIVIRSNADPNASVDAVVINLVYSVIFMVINALVLYFVYGRGGSFSKKKSGIE